MITMVNIIDEVVAQMEILHELHIINYRNRPTAQLLFNILTNICKSEYEVSLRLRDIKFNDKPIEEFVKKHKEAIYMTINENLYDEKLYEVAVGTGTVWTKNFKVYANHEQEAADLVADYIEAQEMGGLYTDFYEIADLCEIGETVEEYAESNNLVCCGNHGIYLQIIRIKEVKNG